MSIKDEVKKFLADQIVRWVMDEGITQTAAATAIGLTQPRLSNLMRGQLEKFSGDCLMECLQNIGYEFRLGTEKDRLDITMVNFRGKTNVVD